MAEWDAEAISKLFMSEAQSAEGHLTELTAKARTNRSFERICDQHLARYYLYNYLQGRSFLFSRETLLAELKVLAQTRFTIPREAYDPQRFEDFRQHYISALINDLGANAGTKH